MNYAKFIPEQKVLIQSLVKKVESSGCNTEEIIEVLTEVCGSLLSYMAPTREELTEYVDNKLLPEMRRVAMEWYDHMHAKDEY